MQINRNKIRARRNIFLAIVIIAMVVSGLAYILKWWLYDRFLVSTDNAFVNGNLVPVYADAKGIVTQVLREETEYVKKGELLIKLDEQRAKAAFGEAEGELGNAVRAVGALFASRRQACQKIISRTALLDKVHHDILRYREALPSGSVSKQVMQNAEDQRAAVKAELEEAKAEFQAIESRVGRATRFAHPEIESRKNKFIEAYIELTRQRIRAPIDGYIAKRKAQVGDRVKPGDQLLTVVPLDHLWVEANLWESDLREVRPGQPALVVADIYGKTQTYHGRVEGLVPGSGSVFAVLPPDNATGNFIHIVQRVPVRIGLRKDELLELPLRPGLSTVTSIDIHDSTQSPNAALTVASSKEYETDIYAQDFTNAQIKADQIIRDNVVSGDDAIQPSCRAAQ